jgi:hypothetical protein
MNVTISRLSSVVMPVGVAALLVAAASCTDPLGRGDPSVSDTTAPMTANFVVDTTNPGGVGVQVMFDFGTCFVGQIRDARICVRNFGLLDSVTLISAAIGGADSADFAWIAPPTFPVRVAPLTNLRVVLRFRPRSAGMHTASLEVVAERRGKRASIPLTLRGTGVIPDTLAVPAAMQIDTIDFGTLRVGTTADVTDGFNNPNGSDTVIITRVAIVGAAAPQFGLSTPAFPVIVQPHGRSDFVFSYRPTAAGTVEAIAMITYLLRGVRSDLLVDLKGNGISPVVDSGSVRFALDSADLGDTPIGTVRDTSLFVISTLVSDSAKISPRSIGGADSMNFTVLAPTMQLIPPASTRAVRVRFIPTRAGFYDAIITLDVKAGAENWTTSIRLRARGY